MKPTKGAGAGSVSQGNFLNIIKVCPGSEDTFTPFTACLIIDFIPLNVRELEGGKLK